ncbi:hypothetical protein BLNAU_10623 [Blattamonas nauphoetae]|uniref:TmcB/TmcC TPR repeats domain-containing protein n=1 Tax=Blattamonas nauphoetae TaxID=2049346 RepID=A0ABQ9XRT6_9EUKA|nr:hypothetical protein BLNAU_10623 [Blattamonas nauphoetae]
MDSVSRADENCSVARSVSSELSAYQTLSGSRFSIVDQLLFFFFYPLFRNISLPGWFNLVVFAVTVLQWIGLTTRFHVWPVSGQVGNIVYSVFHYLDFSISWMNDSSLFILLVIMCSIYLLSFTLSLIFSILSKHEKQIPKRLYSLSATALSLLCTLFALPFVNVCVGALHCVMQHDSSFPYPLQCSSITKPTSLVLGLVFLVLFAIPSFFYHFFAFDTSIGKSKPFATNTNFVPGTLFVCTVVLSILSPVLFSYPAVPLILTTALFLVSTVLFIFYRPLFSTLGNSLYAAGCSIGFISSLSSVLSLFLFPVGKTVHISLPIVFMVCTILLAIGLAIGSFFLSSFLSRRAYAMRPDDSVPITHRKKKLLIDQHNNSQKHSMPQQELMQTTDRDAPPTTKFTDDQTQAVPSITSVLSSPQVIFLGDISDSKQHLPSPQTHITVSEPRTPTGNYMSLIPSDRQSTQRFTDSAAAHTRKPSSTTRSSTNLVLPRALPKYKYELTLEYAIRFIQQKELRNNQEAQDLLMDLLKTGNERFPGSSSFWTITALLEMSVSNNPQRAILSFQKSKVAVPHLIERWIEFSFLRDLEHSKSKQGEATMSTLFRTGLERATKNHEIAKTYMRHVWTLLGKGHFDLERLHSLLVKGMGAGELAKKEYRTLLESFPTSTQVLRGYGALIRDIDRQDDVSMVLLNQATLIEESSQMHAPDESASLFSKGSIERTDGQSMAGTNYRSNNSTRRRQKGKKKTRKNRRASGLSNLVEEEAEERNGLALDVVCILQPVVSIVFFAVSLIVCFVIFNQNVAMIDEILQFSLVQVYSTNILIDTKIWHSFFSDLIVADPGLVTRCWYMHEAEINGERITSAALKLADATRTLYVNCIEKLKPGFDSPVYRFYFTSVDSFMQISDIWPDDISALEMLTHVINSGFHLAEYGNVVETVTNNERFFITLNIPLIEMEVVKETAVAFSEQMKSGSNVSIFVTVVCVALLTIYTVFPTTFVLCFQYRKNLTHRRSSFFNFVNISKKTAQKLKDRLNESDKNMVEDDSTLFETRAHIDNKKDFADNDSKSIHSEANLDEFLSDDDKSVAVSVKSGRGDLLLRSPSELAGTQHFAMQPKLPVKALSKLQISKVEPDSAKSQATAIHLGEQAEGAGKEEVDEQPKLEPVPSRRLQRNVPNAQSTSSFIPLHTTSPLSTYHSAMPIKSMSMSVLPPLQESMFHVPNVTGSSILSFNSPPEGMLQHHPFRPVFSASQMISPSNSFMHSPNRPAFSNAEIWESELSEATALHKTREEAQSPELDDPPAEAAEHQAVELDEEEEMLRDKVKSMGGLLPKRIIFLYLCFNILLFASFGSMFAVTIVAQIQVAADRNQIFFSLYRLSLLNVINFLVLQIAFPAVTEPPKHFPFESTRPGWTDFSHLTQNATRLQQEAAILINHVIAIHNKCMQGAKPGDGQYLSGDELMDSVEVTRTLVPNSEMARIALQPTTCLMDTAAECAKPRIYGIQGEFLGLEGLLNLFFTAAQRLTLLSDPSSAITPDHQDLQLMVTGMREDVYNGVIQYSRAIQAHVHGDVETWQQTLVVMVVVGISGVVLSLMCFLCPANMKLKRVEQITRRIEVVDGHNDTTLRSIQWEDWLRCDIPRFDYSHSKFCETACAVITAMDRDDWNSIKHEVVGNFVNCMMSTINDEEMMMSVHKCQKSTVQSHCHHHSFILKRMLYALIALHQNQNNAQYLFIQAVSLWRSSHVTVHDRQMAVFLESKLTQSEAEEEIDLSECKIPPSYNAFLASDQCSLADKKAHDKFIRILNSRRPVV